MILLKAHQLQYGRLYHVIHLPIYTFPVKRNKGVLLILSYFTKTFQGLFNFVKLVKSCIYL